MQIEYIATDSLINYARNSRTHSEAQVDQIAASIKEFGFTNPVLISDDGTIIAGHGRVMAAKKLKMAEVPCIKLSHLNATQRKAYVIVDNQMALNAGWNYEMLSVEIDELNDAAFNIHQLGFTQEQLDELIGSPTIGDEEESENKDGKDSIVCPYCLKEFAK